MRKRQRAALSRYRSGLRIIVAAPAYGQMIGRIIHPNQETITMRMKKRAVLACFTAQYTDAEDDMTALVSEEMPFLW
ncbi:hypothetical protein [Brucella pseudogrignonensis]|uniref:Uncharacterized protein n=1 Tax=Brucella pseudogrignonensis TaxID=419475 RepID=A0ABU1MAW1_9HYPH|nr:hypothetical protein [Brucella pseudogrignonensis]MDR6433169.1 hypothetical protein [Brucella pseudogrignonensis]